MIKDRVRRDIIIMCSGCGDEHTISQMWNHKAPMFTDDQIEYLARDRNKKLTKKYGKYYCQDCVDNVENFHRNQVYIGIDCDPVVEKDVFTEEEIIHDENGNPL